MKFVDMLKQPNINEDTIQDIEDSEKDKTISESDVSAEEVLRKEGIKIKLITPTAFGTQIDVFKMPDDIDDILKDFNIKIKNKSIFILD